MKELNAALIDATTLCAVGDERIHFIEEFFLPKIRLLNSQQDSKAEQYNAQVSEIF